MSDVAELVKIWTLYVTSVPAVGACPVLGTRSLARSIIPSPAETDPRPSAARSTDPAPLVMRITARAPDVSIITGIWASITYGWLGALKVMEQPGTST